MYSRKQIKDRLTYIIILEIRGPTINKVKTEEKIINSIKVI